MFHFILIFGYLTCSSILVWHLQIALAEFHLSDKLSHLSSTDKYAAFLRPSLLYSQWRLYVCVFFLGPARLFALVFVLVCATLTSFVSPKHTQTVYRAMAGVFSAVQGLQVEFRGSVDPRAAAFAANHCSALDEHIGWLVESEIAWVAKSEVQRIPCLGRMCRAVGSIFVDRKSHEGRATAVKMIGNFLRKFEGGKRLFVFPEGTCTNGLSLLPFKETVFSFDALIQPVCLKYTPAHVSFPIVDNILVHLAMLFALPQVRCQVTLLPAVKRASDARMAISECGGFRLVEEVSHRTSKELKMLIVNKV